ncbi:MAG TPA: hypothetical protein VH560_18185 [Polyangia bacterium]|nr:hypothetical protein [Polyangia bacterium]
MSLFALLAVVTGAAGCHKADRCRSICEERQTQLGCHPKEDCQTSCKKLHATPTCQPELKKFEECFLAKPADKWMCDANGLPVVRGDECATERHVIMGCLEMGGNPAPAKKL